MISNFLLIVLWYCNGREASLGDIHTKICHDSPDVGVWNQLPLPPRVGFDLAWFKAWKSAHNYGVRPHKGIGPPPRHHRLSGKGTLQGKIFLQRFATSCVASYLHAQFHCHGNRRIVFYNFNDFYMIIVRYHCGGRSKEVKLMRLELIHGLFITYTEFRLSTTFISGNYYYAYIQLVSFDHYRHSLCTRIQVTWFQINPLASCFLNSLLLPFMPSLLTWNPPCCDRIPPPCIQVARKLTSHFPPLAHIPPIPKSRPPGVFQIQIYIH